MIISIISSSNFAIVNFDPGSATAGGQAVTAWSASGSGTGAPSLAAHPTKTTDVPCTGTKPNSCPRPVPSRRAAQVDGNKVAVLVGGLLRHAAAIMTEAVSVTPSPQPPAKLGAGGRRARARRRG
jgi:hypothetical protein